MTDSVPHSLFEGVRILSLAEQYPGPFATLLFADLGADVILVERPGSGDPGRAFPAFFRSLARNKRSVCVDLKSENGRQQFKQLVAESDVVLEGFRPGTMARLGVGYEVLRQVNPRLIFASISGFGQDGPYRDRTAHDLSYQAIAGHLFDRRSDESAVPSIAYGDLGSAMFAAFSIAGALYGREKTGTGTSIDISMTDGLVSWMTTYLSPAMTQEKGLELFDEPAYGVFRTSDGRRLTLSIAHEDHFWSALCKLIGLSEHAGLRGPERIARRTELRASLHLALKLKTLAEWAPLLDASSIPWSPLNELEDVLLDRHFQNRGLFQTISRPDGSQERHVMQPVRFDRYPTTLRRIAPGLGEHTEQLLPKERAT